MPMPVKRALFQTPMRSTKRRKTSPRKTTMRVPKSLIPETKQFRLAGTSPSTGTDYAFWSMLPAQGDGGAQFIGSKFRILRIRVFYDFTQLTLSESVRISLVIPKDTSQDPTLNSAIASWDTHEETVLYDMLLPDAQETLAGTFDVKGPINVETSVTGSVLRRNKINLYIHSAGNGTNFNGRVNFAFWYTDA